MSSKFQGLCRFRELLLVLGALALAAAALAGAGQWTSSGPTGGDVYAFATDPSAPSKVFALGAEGLIRSTDGGASWSLVNGATQGFYGLAIAPSKTSRLYALTSQGKIALSDDEGATWSTVNPHLAPDNSPTCFAIDPLAASTLYLGTTQGVFKTTDAGLTWEQVSGLPLRVVGALAIDPSNGSIVYASFDDARGYRSADGGDHWDAIATPFAFTCLTISPSRPSTIYGCATGVFQSVDGGTSWLSSPAVRGLQTYAIAVDPRDSSTIYAATQDGLFRSPDGGATASRVRFGPVENEDVHVAAMTFTASSPTTLLLGSRGGILRSRDGGSSWTFVNAGSRASIFAVGVDPSIPGRVYAGGYGGVFLSADDGTSWTPPNLATPEAYAFAADARTPSTVFAAGVGVSKSTDGGATWKPTDLDRSDTVLSLAISPFDASVILAGTVAGKLFRSTHGGEGWEPLGPLPFEDAGYPPGLTSIAFDPSNPSVLYVAGDGYYSYFGQSAVFKTVDGGSTWADLGIARSGAHAVVVDPESPSTVYVATGDGILKSLDAGANWIHLAGPQHATTLAIDPAQPSTVYAGGPGGVFQSNDRGTTWGRLGPDLPAPVTSLAISPDGRQLHAGTFVGVFDFDFSLEDQGPCTAAPDTLCLLGGRFRVTVSATDVHNARTASGVSVPQGDRFGYFSLPDFTGDATFPEVFVKMVDGTWLPHGSFWVFYNGLTNLPYTIVITDTVTGVRRVYSNEGFCGGADTSAFSGDLVVAKSAGVPAPSTLSASGADLSLLGGRFQVALSATNPRDGRVSQGSAIAQGDRFGYFSLPDFTGDPDFPEVCVKMVDATSFAGAFWFFHASLTSLSYTLTVTDSVTGDVREYENGGDGLCGGADTRAFPK